MSSEKFSFMTDVHGNLNNVDVFLRESQQRGVEHVIFGGDIAPKKMALQFTSGEAKAFSNADTDLSDQFKAIGGSSADEVYRTGYMLFQAGYSKDEIEGLARTLSALGERPLTFEEHEFLQQHRTLLENLVAPSGAVSRLYAYYQKQYNVGKRPQDALRTPAQFIEKLLDHLWYEAQGAQARPSTKQGRDIDQSRALSAVSFTLGPYEAVLRGLSQLGPWHEWAQINQELHRHGESGQRKFVQDLLQSIRGFRQHFRGSVSIILGNDDMACLEADLDEADRAGMIKHASNKVVRLSDTTQMLGLSTIPPIPIPGIYDHWFASEEELAEKLRQLAAQLSAEVRHTIFNIHCPPRDSKLDLALEPGIAQTNWGSTAVREFIEQFSGKVDLALFGHIHESWKIFGNVRDQIAGINAYNPGASEYLPRLLFGDLQNPDEYEIL